MTELQIKSWILLSTALASKSRPATYDDISGIADGINHAIPNHRELQNSLGWLISKGIVIKQGKQYCLTELGKEIVAKAETNTNLILNIWENLDKTLEEIEIKNNG